MVELFDAVTSWRSVLVAVGAFGFAPGFVLRLAVKIYPRDDPRRQEVIADLYVMRRIERPFYVAEQLETVLVEGLPERLSRMASRVLRPQRVRRRIRRIRQLAHIIDVVAYGTEGGELSTEDQAAVRVLHTRLREEMHAQQADLRHLLLLSNV